MALYDIEKITSGEDHCGLENCMRREQVVGADTHPATFAEAIKFPAAGGKVFGDEFLFQWLPMLIAESAGAKLIG
jgi:hypothetical protein